MPRPRAPRPRPARRQAPAPGPWRRLLPFLPLLLGSLLLPACGETAPAERPPPVSRPAATWDLSRLPAAPAALESWTTPEGVLVEVLRRGEGPEAGPETAIDLHYRGYRLDGHLLAEEVWPLNAPGQRRLADLLPGLRQGLGRLRPGERRRVRVPAAQAFGWQSPSVRLPPGTDLVFDLAWPVLRVEDLRLGAGPEARAGQEVQVHYRGQLEDGTVFEDSRQVRDRAPVTLQLVEGRAIAGWVRGVPGLRVGGLRRLSIPSHLAYGAQGHAQGKIPPHADLTFTIELFAARDAPAAAPTRPADPVERR